MNELVFLQNDQLLTTSLKVSEQKNKIKICPICGKSFVLTVHNKIYCSTHCRRVAEYHRLTLKSLHRTFAQVKK